MNISAIFHRPLFGYCTVLTDHKVEIKLQTGLDINEVFIVFGDPYLWQKEKNNHSWQHQEVAMNLLGQTSVHKYWEIILHIPTQRLKYYFRLKSSTQSICFGDRGIFDDSIYGHWNGFFLPFIRNQEALNPPLWTSQIVWYQIFFDRFNDGDPSNNRKDGYSWNDEASFNGYFGGDGQGILDQLEHLKEIGYTGIYLTPIFHAKSNHKYDTIDYYTVDPDFGDLNLLKELIHKAHQLDMKVMLDGVFNHSGTDFFAFRDVLLNGKDSKYYDWFHIEQLHPPLYQTFATTKSMPKLNTDHPQVQQYFLEVMKYWIEDVHIDAWRIDVANEIAHSFYRKMYHEIKQDYPDFYLVAEIWHDPLNWLNLEFDAAMNYQLGFLIKDLINTRNITTFIDHFYTYQFKYPTLTRQTTFTMLDSHDTHRLRYLMDNHLGKTLLALAFLSLQQGGICQLYGTEYALLGEKSEFDRALYPIHPSQQQLDFKDQVQKLLSIRHDHISIITHGTVSFQSKNNLFYYQIDEKLQLIVNLTTDSILLDMDEMDLFTQQTTKNRFLDPYQFVIIK